MPDGFWRVTRWPEPFDPPPPPLPVGHPDLREDDAGRWDDPRGAFSTLYCATEPEGALGEKLGHFRIDPRVPRRIEAFLQSEPDSGYEDDYLLPQLDADDIAGFGWTLAWASSEPAATCIDVTHWRSHRAVFRCAIPHLVEHGRRQLDRSALLDERRNLTRQLAGCARALATRVDGTLRVARLRYQSRHPPAWECWALWEPLPLDGSEGTTEPVTIQTPALRRAAEQLPVVLLT